MISFGSKNPTANFGESRRDGIWALLHTCHLAEILAVAIRTSKVQLSELIKADKK